MTYRRYEIKVFFFTLVLFAALGIAAFLVLRQLYVYELLVLPVLMFLFFYGYDQQVKSSKEIEEFAAAVRYKDFSRQYNEKEGSAELRELRKGFNEISRTLKEISKERETHYQYLQNIMELVDTGILSYDMETGEVGWMNESLKQMLKLPYLKNVHSLAKRNTFLTERILALHPGSHEVCSIQVDNIAGKILLSATAFQTENRTYKLIAFQNTDQVLDESEANAWQKLLRVMTHEIMNSVAPISSLADTLHKLAERAEVRPDAEIWEDLKTCIATIKNRSEGLLKFAGTYRNLNKINTLNSTEALVRKLFENIHNLLLPTLERKGITFEIVIRDPQMSINMDVNLIEQALINLVLNAIDAVKDRPNPIIVLSAWIDEKSKPVVKISDNGHGIDGEIADKIFVPFFTTKKNGNGIGLSLCRQIMMLHKGNIQVQSDKSAGTEFTLHFQ